MFNQEDRLHLEKKWQAVEERVELACKRVGRSTEEVTIIGVSKTVEADVINASIEIGVKDLGENRVQEVLRKYDAVSPGVQWHLIGHLQSNKVKYIIPLVTMIHSVDSLKLAKEINKEAKKCDKIMKVLVQVDMAKEDSKFGVAADDVKPLLESMAELENIQIQGLMFIAPFLEDAEGVRPYFKEMKLLFESLKVMNHPRIEMKHLSMGMTNDFEVAVEEGATLLRVGTGIYGKREVQ